MTTHSPWLRAASVALLGVLLATASAQAVLEARETVGSRAGIERTHQSGCVRLHDHRFCILSGRTPWSPAPVQACVVATPAGAEAAVPATDDRPVARAARYSPPPRSPPVRS